jgi:hypothetical protein
VATVAQDGRVTSVAAGTVTITATALCCSVSDRATVTVTVPDAPPPPPTVAAVEVSPPQVTFDQVGQTLQLTAIAYDAQGNVVSTPITWSSSNSAVAPVSSNGMVTARAVGTALITAAAACCSQSDASQITVSQQQPPPPPPSGVWAEQTWNYPDKATMDADPALFGGGNAGGQGESRPVVLSQPGPWGGVHALENYYGVTPATAQPQVGTYWRLPQRVREIWVETWVQFGPTWEIGPDNPNYPGNYDHKVMFVMETDGGGGYPSRWEWKVGVFGDLMSTSAHDHDTYYEYMTDPGTGQRLRGPTDAWDGQWHHVQWHLRMGESDGRMRLWWDGVLVADSGPRNMGTAGRQFDAILFGGNRNQGTNHPMSFFFGPARVYLSNPGW